MSIRKFANEEERNNAIRARANEIWQQEGHPNGRDKEHWTMAESEIDGTGVKLDTGKKTDKASTKKGARRGQTQKAKR